jgi:glycosyltransferase A (GT-A) superfamily protein (DUF2064 family)
MSRATVLDQTLQRARAERLSVEVLPPHYDVDTEQDLERLVPELTPSSTPRTLHWVRTAR